MEEASDIRYEYHNGEVFAMSGAAPKHSALSSNVNSFLRANLPPGCRPFDSDLKVFVDTLQKGFHPDVSVACRPTTGPDEINAINNPILIVEVLSPSTADYDPVSTAGGQKFWFYAELPSLREYVLIEQKRQAVEVRYRPSSEGKWVMAYYEGEDAEILLRSLDLRLKVSQDYEDTEDLS
ncbi:MAG: Uma2 family endonuclease [Tunicatimonas sp.]|uniref:Uma2 family endonuclease n=1 Tax=Tunicatimonas sp. TaxID=1940096 RepID=UPI003C71CF76